MYEISKSDTIEFFFIEGPVECAPGIGIEEQYDGPYHRFLDEDAPHMTQVVGPARALRKSATSAEDFARELAKRDLASVGSSHACDYVEQKVEEHVDGPFDGILGFSEGASVAASLMLRRAAQNKIPLFRYAIFFCAILTLRFDGKGAILADERPERISVPTLHFVGSRDPAHLSSMTLFNLCDPDLAILYDHGKGHTIPWGPHTENIAKGIREVIQRAQTDS